MYPQSCHGLTYALIGWTALAALRLALSSEDDVVDEQHAWNFVDDPPVDFQPQEPVAPPTVNRPPQSVVPMRFYTAAHNPNPHPHHNIINSPHTCHGTADVFLLILVRTTHAHAQQRAAIRETWGSRDRLLPNATTRLVFLLGLDAKTKRTGRHQAELEEEQVTHQDIVQQDFLDSYGNLTLKTTMAFKWVRAHCRQARYVLIADDDVVVDIYKLAAYLENQKDQRENRFSLCYLYPCCRPALWRGLPHDLGPHGKEYGGTAYPPYCAGAAYVTSADVIDRLYTMAEDTPQFAPDDAWVGVLAEKLRLQFTDTFKSFVGIHSNEKRLVSYFNHSYYLNSAVMVAVLPTPTNDQPPQEARSVNYPASHAPSQSVANQIRTIWSVIQEHHRDRPRLDVPRYMRLNGYMDRADNHVYTIAFAALLLDLAALTVIGYLIFCRKRTRVINHR